MATIPYVKSPGTDFEIANITISSQTQAKKLIKKNAAAAPAAPATPAVPADLPASDPPVCSQVSKKMKLVLSDEHEEALLEFLQANPSIYDKTMTDYKLTGKKEALWQVQADLMGLTKDDIKLWFTTQRTLYRKLSKDGVSGEGAKQQTERQNWILAKFQFMGTHITRQAKPCQPASLWVKLVQKAPWSHRTRRGRLLPQQLVP